MWVHLLPVGPNPSVTYFLSFFSNLFRHQPSTNHIKTSGQVLIHWIIRCCKGRECLMYCTSSWKHTCSKNTATKSDIPPGSEGHKWLYFLLVCFLCVMWFYPCHSWHSTQHFGPGGRLWQRCPVRRHGGDRTGPDGTGDLGESQALPLTLGICWACQAGTGQVAMTTAKQPGGNN